MADYPVALNLAGRLCVVVGAGSVGRRKATGLLEAGARVRLVDPRLQADDGLATIEQIRRAFEPKDLQGAFLVFAATDDAQLNRKVAAAARAFGALVQAVDDPALSDFHLPAILRRGALTLAVFTGGHSPALAVALRDQLAQEFGEEWAKVLEVAAALRKRRLTVEEPNPYNLAVLRELLSSGLPHLLAAKDYAAVDRLLQKTLGKNINLERLHIPLAKGLK
jgi:precorrin-2 dehydrogenase / sirohydrochlorin ferrochelatase